MSRIDPKNREEAFAHQFEDDVKILHSLALLNKESFKKHLAVVQAHIDAYNDKGLQESCDDAVHRHKVQQAYMKDNYPGLY